MQGILYSWYPVMPHPGLDRDESPPGGLKSHALINNLQYEKKKKKQRINEPDLPISIQQFNVIIDQLMGFERGHILLGLEPIWAGLTVDQAQA